MKSDRDFLNGVYHKAEELKRLDSVKTQPTFRSNYKWLITAATLTLVVSLNLYFNTSHPMRIKVDKSNQAPSASRFRNYIDINDITENADIVVSAKVKKISKSVNENGNITTTVELTPKEVYKGALKSKTIDVVVMGGYDESTKTYSEYEAIFERKEDTLLFLNKIDDKYFLTCSSQGKYTYIKTSDNEITYKSSGGEILTLTQVKELIKKER